jgi:hypothetical protein
MELKITNMFFKHKDAPGIAEDRDLESIMYS